jgi:hypothetical protein
MISKTFPELSNFSFGLLFRDKIKKSKGRITLAEICLPNKLLSYYARNDDGAPFDFLMIVDEMIWACARPEDRIRLIRHELRHVLISDKGKPQLIDHDFADFFKEVELNTDDPTWANRLCEIAEAGYKQVKDGQKDPRIDRVDAEDLAPVTKSPQRQVQLEAAMNDNHEAANNALKKSSEKDAGVTVKIDKPTGKPLSEVFSEPADAEASKVLTNLHELAKKKGLIKETVTA